MVDTTTNEGSAENVSGQHEAATTTVGMSTGLINRVLGAESVSGGFWGRWGITDGLFTLGLAIIILGLAATLGSFPNWDDPDMFATLAFGLTTIGFGLISLAMRNRNDEASERRRLEVFQAQLNYQERLHAIASQAGSDASEATLKDMAQRDAQASTGFRP